jgi:8-oxo-dGTP pyrophosphatase MutT (NUDIX family)
VKEISAGVIIYRRTKEGPKFLLLYHGGRYWNFPKGKIEKTEKGKETAFKAAIREVQEETGITARDLKFGDWFKAYDRFTFRSRDKKKVFKTVTYYLAETSKAEIKISPNTHYGYGWFLYKDAQNILIHKNLRDNLKRAYEAIKRGRVSSRKKNTPR